MRDASQQQRLQVAPAPAANDDQVGPAVGCNPYDDAGRIAVFEDCLDIVDAGFLGAGSGGVEDVVTQELLDAGTACLVALEKLNVACPHRVVQFHSCCMTGLCATAGVAGEVVASEPSRDVPLQPGVAS